MPPRRKLNLRWQYGGVSYRILIAENTGTVTATGTGFTSTGIFEYQPWFIHEFRRWNNAERTEFARTVIETSAR